MNDPHHGPGEPGAPVRALPLLAPADLNEEQRALYTKITTGRRASSAGASALLDSEGRLTGPFNALLFAPHVGDAAQELGSRIRYGLSLSDREREIATLLVAARCGSGYELFAHRRLAAAAGLTPAEVDSASRGVPPDLADSRERQVAALCEALIDGTLPENDARSAVERLGARLVVELTILVGYYQLLARLLNVAGVTGADEQR